MITVVPLDYVVDRGYSTTFSCAAVGNGTLNITWRLPSGEIVYTGQHMEEVWSVNSSISVLDISADDGGNYTCIVENEAGTTEATANLSVRLYIDDPQQTTLNTTNGTVESVVCATEGFPVGYRWEKAEENSGSGGSGLIPDSSGSISDSSVSISGSISGSSGLVSGSGNGLTFAEYSIGRVLVFDPAVFGDEGVYRCVASGLGEEVVSVPTTVTSKVLHLHSSMYHWAQVMNN